MAIPELGSKQICPNCQAKFYDLTKRPAVCPKCQNEFDPDEAVRNRRVRARTIVPERDPDEDRDDQVKEAVETDEDEEEEVVVAPIDEVVDEPPVITGDDDDDDDAEPGLTPVADDELAGFTEEEEIEDDADVPFLEDDEDDDFDESEIEGLPEEGDER